MLELVFGCLLYLLPAGAANITPVIAARLWPKWQLPVDAGFQFRHRRIFGAHKTWRGLVSGILASGIAYLLTRLTQPLLANHAAGLVGCFSGCFFGYFSLPLWFGFWQGTCALTGDLLKSFLKRQLRIAPGESWKPYDQIDWAIASLVGSWPFLQVPAGQGATFAALYLVFGMFFSGAFHRLGYWLGLNRAAA